MNKEGYCYKCKKEYYFNLKTNEGELPEVSNVCGNMDTCKSCHDKEEN